MCHARTILWLVPITRTIFVADLRNRYMKLHKNKNETRPKLLGKISDLLVRLESLNDFPLNEGTATAMWNQLAN